jgi:hypothetical protein
MKLDTTFLRSKVSRRIFGLFVCCALLPIVILSIVSFGHVAKQLNEQNHRQIHQESKNVGMAIFERLLLLEMEMKTLAFNFRRDSGTTSLSFEGLPERLKGHFKNLTLITGNGDTIMHVLGRIEAPPVPTPSQMKFLSTGNTVVSSRYSPNSSSTVFMMYPANSENPCRRILVGEIDTAYLWSIGHMNTLPPMTELCILDASNNVLLSSIPVPETFSRHIATKTDSSTSCRFKWKYEDKEYLASYWTIFLKVKFFTPKWTVVLSRSKSDVFAPLANFKKTFPLVVLLSLWVVLLLSIVQIRKNLVPLEELKKGTERIATSSVPGRPNDTSCVVERGL